MAEPQHRRTQSSIHLFFEAQVEQTPDTIAVTFEGQSLTYRELNIRANQLAHYLRKRGVEPEMLVGICVERSVDMVVGIWGILKAGGAYVPIDPGYPEARITYLIQDACISLLLTQSHLQLPSHQADMIRLDGEWEIIAAESKQNLASPAQLDHACYVIYTSGSTGNPKGVVVTHRNLIHSTAARYQTYPGRVNGFLLLSSFAFDSSVAGIFWTLTTGGTLFLIRHGLERDISQLGAYIGQNRISHLLSLPSLYNLLLEQVTSARLQSLQTVIVAGEACPVDLIDKHMACLPQTKLYNEYGPTEGTVWATVYEISQKLTGAPVPIGRSIPGTQVFILNEHLHPVADGEEGELCIGGDGVARGYLNRPALTAGKFMPDPFIPPTEGGKEGGRLYKTGDLARLLPDGHIEFLGRIDHQVKVRGYRIELGEIEAVLRQHTAVSQAAVSARTFRHQSLVAYIVANRDLSVSELRGFLHQRLPDYMVPSLFVMLDALPVTPNGKVDRQALPAPDRKRPQLDQPYVPPRTDLERYLADLWADILELDQVGVEDRYFELGGDSIQAAQFINRLQDTLGESIFVVTIFDAPSIAEYAAFLQSEYADAVARRFGGPPFTGRQERQNTADTQPGINRETVAHMRSYIPCLRPDNHVVAAKTKNRPALFILAPPRSGTTLLRVMLAGHPGLFAASELNLLGFHTLRERRAALDGRFSLWLEGAIQAIMTLKDCDADEARAIIAGYEQQDYTTRQFYDVLQSLAGERMLVDKTPAYALDQQALHKAEQDFEAPLYIHLVRHPYAMIRSFARVRMAQVMYLKRHPFSGPQLGELVWLISHQNIRAFLQSVPAHRQYRLRYEELVKRPSEVMIELCQTLRLTFHPAMLEPYQDMDQKMTTGIYKDSKPMGDPKFLEQQTINPQLAESWRGVLTDDFLSDITWEQACSLGYERPKTAARSIKFNRQHSRRALLAQRRQKSRTR